jgi:hypothetical protein
MLGPSLSGRAKPMSWTWWQFAIGFGLAATVFILSSIGRTVLDIRNVLERIETRLEDQEKWLEKIFYEVENTRDRDR